MADGFLLSEADLKVLKGLLEESRQRQQNRESFTPRDEDNDHQAPEVYVALTPAEGIPALETVVGTANEEGDKPGSAECDIYQPVESEGVIVLEPIGATRLVHNLTAEAVKGYRWVLTARDKFGKWFMTADLSGKDNVEDKGNGECDLAGLQRNDFVFAHGPYNSVILSYTAGRWVSRELLYYYDPPNTGTGSGTGSDLVGGIVEFWFDKGSLHLSVNAESTSGAGAVMELLSCGNGCFKGGALTGHFPSHGAEPCQGGTFTVCVACVETSVPCPNVTCGHLPKVLYATFSDTGLAFSPCFVAGRTLPLYYREVLESGISPEVVGSWSSDPIDATGDQALAVEVFGFSCVPYVPEEGGQGLFFSGLIFNSIFDYASGINSSDFRTYYPTGASTGIDCENFSITFFGGSTDGANPPCLVTITDYDPSDDPPPPGADCCAGNCAAIGSPPLTATFTDKAGCFLSMPDTLDFTCTDDGDGHYWLSDAFAACAGTTATILCTGTGHPQLVTPATTVLADDGYTCNPFSAVFHLNNLAGDSATVTVTG